MSIKTFAIALAAVAVTATSASANSFFAQDTFIESSDNLRLGSVVSAGAGIVEIYDYRTGTQGKLLGTKSVHAGLNNDVRVGVGFAPSGDILAVIKVNGQVVHSEEFDTQR